MEGKSLHDENLTLAAETEMIKQELWKGTQFSTVDAQRGISPGWVGFPLVLRHPYEVDIAIILLYT